MKLLQTQKNEVYEIIEESGLSPSMFNFGDPENEDGNTYLRLNNSDYYFTFATSASGGHWARYSPGYETPYEDHSASSWTSERNFVRHWLNNLTRELNAPDKWKLLEEELKQQNFGDIKFNETKFTYQEIKILDERISDLKTKISKLDLLEDQIKMINLKLDHLLELAKSMNKTDWKELFVGSIISLFMQLTLDKSVGNTIFGYIKNLFIKLLPSG